MLRSLLRLTALTGLLLGAALASSAQEAPFGDRIGPTLDASEKAYFGLFPTIYAPLPWNLVVRPDSVLLQREGRTLRVIPPSEATALASLIDTFEDYDSVSANPNWSASPTFKIYIDAATPVPATRASSVVRVETTTGSYSGFALYTTDSVLVMASEVLPRRADLPGAYTVPRSEIVGLSRQRPTGWQKWGTVVGLGIGTALGAAFAPDMDRRAAAGFGALVGITAGALTSQQSRIGQTAIPLSSIDSLAVFNRVRPPELPDASSAVARATSTPSSVVLKPRRKRSFEWISVGIHGAVSVAEPDAGIVSTQEATSILPPQRFQSGVLQRNRDELEVPFRLDASVRPIKWLRGGVFVGAFTSGDSLRNLPGREQQLRSMGRVRPYAEAILPLARDGNQRLEVFAGGGRQSYSVRVLHITSQTVDVGRPGQGVIRRIVAQAQQDIRKEGNAWFYNVGLELHSTRFSSLFIRHTWYPIPALRTETFRYRDARDPSIDLRVIEERAVDFSYREVMIGSRFHF